MDRITLNIQRFADGKVVIDTALNTKNFENGLDRMKSTTQKAGSTIKNIVVGLGITKLISAGINQINSSLDGAIARYDTLNNFPKVMSNLGIASDEADKAIKKMSERLSGLPTTLDQGAMAVQRLTSKNGDVGKSTDIFLALNNAILAGGASTEIQASALEQLSQSYAKGKMDMVEWRSIQTAMPAQLKQVATAMGVTTDELGTMLREGKHTDKAMEQFLDTIVKLNTEGLEGFQNFETQARNSTGGIKTSIVVAKTQVVKGVTDIIEALNVRLEKTSIGNLANFIANVGKKAKQGLDVIADLIKGNMTVEEFGKKTSDMINTFLDSINKTLPIVVTKGIEFLSSFIDGFSSNIPTIMNKTIELIINIGNALLDNADKIYDAGVKLINELVRGIEENLPSAQDKFVQLIDKFTDVTMENNPKLLKAGGELALTLIKGMLFGWTKLFPIIIKRWQNAFDKFKELAPQMLQLGKMFIYHFIMSIKDGSLEDSIRNKIDKIKTIIADGLKSILAKALQFISELPYKIGYLIGEIWIHLQDLKSKLDDFIANALPNFINSVVNWFNQLPGKIKKSATDINNSFSDELSKLPGKMYNIAKDIPSGIWEGIKSMKNWLKKKVKEFSQGIVDGVRSALKIHSPSRVFRDEVGVYIAQGLGVGFEDELDSVYNDMQKAINFENAKIQSNVESGKIFNSLVNSTPITISLDASVDMDSQKVGRLVTPSVARTIKNGGVY